MASAGKKATVKVSGTAIAMVDEAMSRAGDGLTAQIAASTKRVLTRSGTYTVEKNGAAFTAYTLDRLTGTITFDVMQASGTFTISGDYLPIAAVSEAHQFSWEIINDWMEDTTFEEAISNGGYVARNTNGLKDVSGTLGRFWDTDTTLLDALSDDAEVVLEFTINNAVDMRAWAKLEGQELSSAVESTNDETISWVGNSDADGRVIAFI